MLPSGLETAVQHLLQEQANDPSPWRNSAPVAGGDINQAARIETEQNSYFLKWNSRPLPGMFLAEARGLAELEAAGVLRVPHVVGLAEAAGDRPAFLLMEWLGSGNNKRDRTLGETLGRGLAALHRHRRPAYGWRFENYIGSLPQHNPDTEDWIIFYRDQRLGVQMELAAGRGRLPAPRRRKLEQLMGQLDRWIDPRDCQPSLLHGDLWGGNYMAGPAGEPVLIDPAVYYGQREVELAFTELFGGFSAAFYAAYNDAWPLPAGYESRKALYQLYPLLVHLNLFGEGYGAAVDGILQRYVGRGSFSEQLHIN